MIRKLRERHRLVIVILTIVLSILFIAALLVRNPIHVNQSIPEELRGNDGVKR